VKKPIIEKKQEDMDILSQCFERKLLL